MESARGFDLELRTIRGAVDMAEIFLGQFKRDTSGGMELERSKYEVEERRTTLGYSVAFKPLSNDSMACSKGDLSCTREKQQTQDVQYSARLDERFPWQVARHSCDGSKRHHHVRVTDQR